MVWAIMHLQIAYDKFDIDVTWIVMGLYEVGKNWVRAVQSLYNGSKACVTEGSEVSVWFPWRAGLIQGCGMSPWLFSVYID